MLSHHVWEGTYGPDPSVVGSARGIVLVTDSSPGALEPLLTSGVPRKYYRLTEAGRTELARLTHEWTTFVDAMTHLLGQREEGR